MNNLPTITVGCPIQDREDKVRRYINGIHQLNYPLENLTLVFLVNNCSDKTEEVLYQIAKEEDYFFKDFKIINYEFNYKDSRKDRDPNAFVEIWNEWLKYNKEDYCLTIDSDVYIKQYDLLSDIKSGDPLIAGQCWNGGRPPVYYYSIYYSGGLFKEENNNKEWRLYNHHTIPADRRRETYGVGGCIRLINNEVFDEVQFQFHPQGEDLGLCDSIKDNTDLEWIVNPSIISFHDMNLKEYFDSITVKKDKIYTNKFYTED